MTEATKELLVRDGSFNYIERENLPEKIQNLRTFWLIGRNTGGMEMHNGLNPNEKDSTV